MTPKLRNLLPECSQDWTESSPDLQTTAKHRQDGVLTDMFSEVSELLNGGNRTRPALFLRMLAQANGRNAFCGSARNQVQKPVRKR